MTSGNCPEIPVFIRKIKNKCMSLYAQSIWDHNRRSDAGGRSQHTSQAVLTEYQLNGYALKIMNGD